MYTLYRMYYIFSSIEFIYEEADYKLIKYVCITS